MNNILQFVYKYTKVEYNPKNISKYRYFDNVGETMWCYVCIIGQDICHNRLGGFSS